MNNGNDPPACTPSLEFSGEKIIKKWPIMSIE